MGQYTAFTACVLAFVWCGSAGLAQPIDAPTLARIIGAVRERVEADGCDGLLRSVLPERSLMLQWRVVAFRGYAAVL